MSTTLFSAKVGVHYYFIDTARLKLTLVYTWIYIFVESASVLEIPCHLNIVARNLEENSDDIHK